MSKPAELYAGPMDGTRVADPLGANEILMPIGTTQCAVYRVVVGNWERYEYVETRSTK